MHSWNFPLYFSNYLKYVKIKIKKANDINTSKQDKFKENP